MQFIDLRKQYELLQVAINRRIDSVLQHGKYISGPEVQELEGKLADYVGVKHAVACANGTDAISLALMALGVGAGDAVFVPTFTFFSTSETVALQGATPIFVDVDERSFNICSQDLENKIAQVKARGQLAPRAVIPVDLFGQPARYLEILNIAKRHDLYVIEDAAQGFGGAINHGPCKGKAGSFGLVSTTSFFPAKPLGCYGDGGAIFTNDSGLAEVLRSLRVHGQGNTKYENIRVGMNSRLDTLQAAILLEKLEVFDSELHARNTIAEAYSEALPEAIALPTLEKGFSSSWAQYTIKLPSSEKRVELQDFLSSRGIPSNIYYPLCLHQLPAMKKYRADSGECPIAEKLSKTSVSLPMHPYLTKSDVLQVSSAVNEFFSA